MIYVMDNMTIGNEQIYGNSNITVQKYGTGSDDGAMFTVNGDSVLSGLVINGTNFTTTVSVSSGSLAVRNGAKIQNSTVGIEVLSGAALELNRSVISGNTCSVFSQGTVTTVVNESEGLLRKTVSLRSPVSIIGGTFNVTSGEVSQVLNLV